MKYDFSRYKYYFIFFNADTKIKEKILSIIDSDENICTTIINVYEILKRFRWKSNQTKENQFKEFLDDVAIFTIDEEVIDIGSAIYADLRKLEKQ